MPLPREHLLDELATAYVQAVAATAGATIAVSRRDYGVDGTLKHIVVSGSRFIESGFPVDFQLKGTGIARLENKKIVYDLRARNYNLLVERESLAAPYYLFLVCFGSDPSRWIVEEPEKLILSASAYWWMPSGKASTNTATVRIEVPAKQRLGAPSLMDILDASKNRFAP